MVWDSGLQLRFAYVFIQVGLFNNYLFETSETRHQCDQGDGLDAYTWTAHDPREGGVEVLKDGKNNVEITIEWLKVLGGDHGGSWAARVKGVPMYSGARFAIQTYGIQI